MVWPRNSKLYTKKEASDKFILILEGRALVTIGQTEMTFEAGPWHCFGNELLDRLHQVTSTMKKPQKSQSRRGSQANLTNAVTNTASNPLNEVDAKKMTFVPDYTAIIKDDCTYLEINAQTYLLAFKSTLINRNRADTQDPRDSISEMDNQNQIANDADAIPLNKITSEGVLEEDVAIVRTNGSIRRKDVRIFIFENYIFESNT